MYGAQAPNDRRSGRPKKMQRSSSFGSELHARRDNAIMPRLSRALRSVGRTYRLRKGRRRADLTGRRWRFAEVEQPKRQTRRTEYAQKMRCHRPAEARSRQRTYHLTALCRLRGRSRSKIGDGGPARYSRTCCHAPASRLGRVRLFKADVRWAAVCPTLKSPLRVSALCCRSQCPRREPRRKGGRDGGHAMSGQRRAREPRR